MDLSGILTMNLVKAKKLVRTRLAQQHFGGDLLSVKLKEEEHPKRKSNTNTPVRKSKTHLKLPQIERFTSDA